MNDAPTSFALEDGCGGVLCIDGGWITAQLIEALGQRPALWPSADLARAEAASRGLRHFSVVPVDSEGRALLP